MALWSVNKTMKKKKLRKKGVVFPFQFFFTYFQGWYLEDPLRRVVCQTGGLAEHYGGFERKERQNKSCWEKGG